MGFRFRSKPQEVEAFQWSGPDCEDELVDEFFGGVPPDKVGYYISFDGDGLELRAGNNGAQGWVPVPIGHWIVRKPGDLTDHWPVDPDYFAAKYDAVPGAER